jgi:hypothetical protein
MRRLLITLFTVCSFVITAHAQSAAQFGFTKTTHDFGSVQRGPDITYDFEFTNTGTQPLMIYDAKGSCSCTKAEFKRDPVLPGQKGKVTARFETKDKDGSFSKTLFIYSNATDRKEPFELFIKGNVLIPKKGAKGKKK